MRETPFKTLSLANFAFGNISLPLFAGTTGKLPLGAIARLLGITVAGLAPSPILQKTLYHRELMPPTQCNHVMNNVGTAYLLWLGCLFQLHGLQRLYNGKIFTGLLWLCTFGLLGFGQLLDLVLIPGMVEEHNTKWRSRYGTLPHAPELYPTPHQVIATPPTASAPRFQRNELIVKLVQAAERRGGRLSVTQAVLDTETEFQTVERALQNLVKTGYVAVYNDVHSGIVMYEFRELLPAG